MAVSPNDLRRRLMICYKGEEGLDYGGVQRYALLFSALLHSTGCSCAVLHYTVLHDDDTIGTRALFFTLHYAVFVLVLGVYAPRAGPPAPPRLS